MDSGWDIFLNNFVDIPKIFLDYLQIISNFLYVCHSVSWLTSLQKLDKCRDNSCSGWDIFLKFLFAYFPTEIRQYRDISYPGSYIFQKFAWEILGMFLHFFQIITNFFYVCQSFSLLTSLLVFLVAWFNTISQSLVFFHPFTQVLQWRSCRPLVLFNIQSGCFTTHTVSS